MRKEVFGTCELYLGDCMEYMAALPDKAVDLAIVDPPYGIGKDKKHWQTSGRGKKAKSRVYDENEWDKPPNKNYFDELFRVSKHQIIWGMQYFCENIPNTEKIIVWDKQNNGFSCSDFEAAWTSFKGKSDLFSYCWIGFSQGVWGRSTPKDKEKGNKNSSHAETSRALQMAFAEIRETRLARTGHARRQFFKRGCRV